MINLLFPLGLAALISIPIIVFLHLRRERLPRVMVPSLLLWQNLPRPRQGQNNRRLPISLLLLLHLLAALLIALALTHPQWLGVFATGEQHRALLIDTSTSMAAESGFAQTRLDQARDYARNLINTMGEQDTFALVEVGTQARLLAAGGRQHQATLLAALDELQAGGTGSDIANGMILGQVALETIRDTESTGEQKMVVITDLERPVNSTLPPEQVDWMRIEGQPANRAIIALEARSRSADASAGYTVFARVANYGNESLLVHVHLFGDDELVDTRLATLQPNGETELTWTLPPGIQLLRAELAEPDALLADNQANLNLAQSRLVNVLLVSNTPEALERALAALPDVHTTTITPDDYQTMSQLNDLVIFDSVLPSDWPDGGVLLINPPVSDGPPLTVGPPRELASNRFGPPELVAPSAGQGQTLIQDLNLGSVTFGLVPQIQAPPWMRTQLAADGVPLILRGHIDQSEVVIWAFDLNQSNLTSKLAFPLLVARTVYQLVADPIPASLLVGESLTFVPGTQTDTLTLMYPDGTTQVQPVSRTLVLDTLMQPGIYTMVEQHGEETIYERFIAVNAGSPLESDLSPRAFPTDLVIPASLFNDTPETAQNQGAYQSVWPLLVCLALVVLMVEWLYIHR
ncbi:MAG: VWA domain-containing protein [Chloroflexaceae bacterium]|nr:VWA domain-containing protein [Chloroflexaceae bacterium]